MMRIHDAAKLLKIASKDLISMLHAMGVEAKNHMAVIADEDYEKLRGKMFNKADLPPASSFVAPVKPVKKTAHHTNPEHKPGPEIKPESKAETKPQPKPVVKPEPKAEPKMEHHEPAKLHATPEPPGAENHVKHEIKKEEHKSAQAAPVVQKPQAAPAQHKPAEHNQKPAAPKPQPKPQPQPEPQPKPAEAVKPAEQPVEEPKEVLELGRSVTVQEMAQKLELKPAELVKKLFSLGMMATMNQTLTEDEIHLIAAEYNKEVKFKDVYGDDIFVEEPDDPKKMVPRGPIVTIMGHVDHGKTSLLDAIRETNVAAGEKGGITQKIGAYKVPTSHGNITFLDTPGHEAFTAMRARGAKSTDIVVLIVAADDGIMPQTVEAIDHARAAGVPIIVAINKIDKDGANPENIKQQLTKYNLVSEEWGGKTQIVPVSAKKKIGIADLLERIALEAEMLELKTNPDATAQGVIIEAKLDRGRGAVGTLLLQKGTIRVGDSFLTNFTYGKVRALFDDKGRRLKEAKSVMPVEILGFEEVPNAGDKLKVFPSEKEVKNISMRRAGEIRRFAEEKKKKKITLEDLHKKIQLGAEKKLNLIIKGDGIGSIEAIIDAISKVSADSGINVQVIHSDVGDITENDVLLADASNAVIVGFFVASLPAAKELAVREGVEIKIYHIIYEVVDAIKAAMVGILDPEYEKVKIGEADVRQVFKVESENMVIAGSYMRTGKAYHDSPVSVIRNNREILVSNVKSLKRFKDTVKEVKEGYECGVVIENYPEPHEGDLIVFYEEVQKVRKL